MTQASGLPGTTSGMTLRGLSRRSRRKPLGRFLARVPVGQVVRPVFFKATSLSLGMRPISGAIAKGLLSSLSISR
ncbi:hypothetical protein D3C87_1841370 [compost metagenome]